MKIKQLEQFLTEHPQVRVQIVWNKTGFHRFAVSAKIITPVPEFQEMRQLIFDERFSLLSIWPELLPDGCIRLSMLEIADVMGLEKEIHNSAMLEMLKQFDCETPKNQGHENS